MKKCYWWDEKKQRCAHNYYVDKLTNCIGESVLCRYYTVETHTPLEKSAIKDSGERTEFPSGAVRDMHAGKGRMDLLPWHAIMEVSKHCENGAIKYGEHNVNRGLPMLQSIFVELLMNRIL